MRKLLSFTLVIITFTFLVACKAVNTKTVSKSKANLKSKVVESTFKKSVFISKEVTKKDNSIYLKLFDEKRMHPSLVKDIKSYFSKDNLGIHFSQKGYITQMEEYNSTLHIAGFGYMNNNHRQGVAVVKQVIKNSSGKIITRNHIYLSPSKHGSIKPIDFNGYTISIKTADGKDGLFNIYDGFRLFPK